MAFEVTPFATDFPGAAGGGRAFVLGENRALDTFQQNLKETMADIARKRTQAAKDVSELDVDMSKVWDADTPYFSKQLSGFRDKAAEFYKWSYSNPNQYGTEEYFKKYNDIKKESDRLRLEADMSAMQKEPWTKANQEYSTKQDEYDEQSLADQAKYRGMNIYQRQAALAGATDPNTGKVEPVRLLTPAFRYDYNKMIKETAENIGDVSVQTDNGTNKVFQLNPYFDNKGQLTKYGKKAYEQAITLTDQNSSFNNYVKAKEREARKAGVEPPAIDKLKEAFTIDVLRAKDTQWKQDVLAPKDDDNAKPRVSGNRYINGNAVVTYTAIRNPSGKSNESPIIETYVPNRLDNTGKVMEQDNSDWSYRTYDASSGKFKYTPIVGRLQKIQTNPANGLLEATVLTSDLAAIKDSRPDKYKQELEKIAKAERDGVAYTPLVEIPIPIYPSTDDKNYSAFLNRYGFTPWDVRQTMTGTTEVPSQQYLGTDVGQRIESKKAAGPGEVPKKQEAAPAKSQMPSGYDKLDAKRKATVDQLMKQNPGKFKSKDEAYQFLLSRTGGQ